MKFIITTHKGEIIEFYPNLYSEYLKRPYTKDELWEELNYMRFIPTKQGSPLYPIMIKTIELVD